MQAILITLGILGFGAVLISLYVFTAAARRYVHERAQPAHHYRVYRSNEKLYITRSGRDRRRQGETAFPIKLTGGEIVLSERRRRERRNHGYQAQSPAGGQ
jgi:hypothetical protein